MNLGPDQIIACPHCGGLAQHQTLLSGNTFGAQVWTDGKQIAPMLPQPPVVVKCDHCARCYWLTDAKEVACVYLHVKGEPNIDPAWRKAPLATEPDLPDYFSALENGFAEDVVQERNLRILTWWRMNDMFRGSFLSIMEALPSQYTEAVRSQGRSNLERLADLLEDEDESDCLMKAEVLRELGRFEEACALLDAVTSEETTSIVHKLRALCEQQDMQVREITRS